MERFGLLTCRGYYAKYGNYILDSHRRGAKNTPCVKGLHWHSEDNYEHVVYKDNGMFKVGAADKLHKKICDYFGEEYAAEWAQLTVAGYLISNKQCPFSGYIAQRYWYTYTGKNLPNIEICFELQSRDRRIFVGGGRQVDTFAEIWQYLPVACEMFGGILHANEILYAKCAKQREKIKRLTAALHADYAPGGVGAVAAAEHFNQIAPKSCEQNREDEE